MAHPTPDEVYEHLKLLERVDTVHSAAYRQEAMEILADLDVSVDWRQAIADRLGDANHLLTLKNVDGDDSY